jgi:hypothetical protein
MIIIQQLNRAVVDEFEDFNELFECIITLENSKSASKDPDFRQMDWNFTVFSPKEVVALYAQTQKPSAGLIEAYEENLSLIEICIGDYRYPVHIPLTPNVDMDYCKEKWCVDWCTYHNFLVRTFS